MRGNSSSPLHYLIKEIVLRLGKPVEHLQAALRAALAAGTPQEQVTTVARQLAYMSYLSLDTIVWANGVKFLTLKPETAQRASKLSNRFWLAGILISIINSLFKVGVFNLADLVTQF
jgi:peroxin-11B